jgi:hypothetical protein
MSMITVTHLNLENASGAISSAFEFNRREYIRACRMIDKYAIRNPIWRWSWRVLLSIVGLFIAIVSIGQFSAGYWETATIGLIPVVSLLLLPLLPLATAYGAARQWEKYNPAGARTVRFDVNDDAVASTSSAGRVELRWSAVRQVVETPEFFLFYMTDKTAIYVPQRTVHPAERIALRSLAQRRTPDSRVRLVD